MKNQADNVKAKMNNLSGNYLIIERDSGFRLHVFRATKKGDADRYGWGAQDLFAEREGVPVRFETEDDAKRWIREHAVFCCDAYIEVDKQMQEMVRAKRGRPATGKAMTAAERKAAQRNALHGYNKDLALNTCSVTALHAAMQRALTQSDVVFGEMLAAEYLRRLNAKSHQDKQTRPGQTK